MFVGNPAESPISLTLDARNSVKGVKEVITLDRVFDIGVNEERVGFGMNVFHHDLETVEATGFGSLNFVGESLDKILIHNAIGGGEESKDVGNEMALIVVKTIVPIVDILGKVDLLSSPERGLSLFVHLPNLNLSP